MAGLFLDASLTGLILTYFVSAEIQETHSPEHVFTFKDALAGYASFYVQRSSFQARSPQRFKPRSSLR